MKNSANLRRSRLVMMALTSTLVARIASPQEGSDAAAPFVVGTRVRLMAPGAFQGTVMEMDEKSLLISTDDHRPLRVSRQAITQLEVSAGRRGNAVKGMLVGAAGGAALFAILPRDEYCHDLGPGETCPTKAQIVGTGAVGGALWGALIGHLIKRDRWVSVPLESVKVSVLPARGRGAQMSLVLAW